MSLEIGDEARRVLRFGSLGLVNTIVTGVLFVLLSFVLPTAVAYTIVYVLGLIVTTVLTSRWVFGREQTRLGRAATFVGWYLAVYSVGLGILWLVESRTSQPPPVVALVVLAITAPMNYLGGRLLFGRD